MSKVMSPSLRYFGLRTLIETRGLDLVLSWIREYPIFSFVTREILDELWLEIEVGSFGNWVWKINNEEVTDCYPEVFIENLFQLATASNWVGPVQIEPEIYNPRLMRSNAGGNIQQGPETHEAIPEFIRTHTSGHQIIYAVRTEIVKDFRPLFDDLPHIAKERVIAENEDGNVSLIKLLLANP